MKGYHLDGAEDKDKSDSSWNSSVCFLVSKALFSFSFGHGQTSLTGRGAGH
jgi:hypothetical protein